MEAQHPKDGIKRHRSRGEGGGEDKKTLGVKKGVLLENWARRDHSKGEEHFGFFFFFEVERDMR